MDGGTDDATQGEPGGPVRTRGRRRRRVWREVRGYLEALAIAFVVVTFVFNTVGVVGASMRPNLDGGLGSEAVARSLLLGDRVFIPKYDTWLRRAGLLGPFERGEIVILREPAHGPTALETGRQNLFIKRVVAIGGDRVRIDGGTVFVNGHAIDPSFITASGEITPDPQDFPVVVAHGGRIDAIVLTPVTTVGGVTFFDLPWRGQYGSPIPLDDPELLRVYETTLAALAPLPPDAPDGVPFVHEIVVPPGHYYVLGDNREYAQLGSEDSRVFGPVPGMAIAGRATAVVWPPKRDGDWNWRVLRPPATFEAVPAPGAPGAATARLPAVPDR